MAGDSEEELKSAVPLPRLNLVVIRSRDIERAVAFYGRLGLAFTAQVHGKGPRHYAAELEGGVFEIYPLRPVAFQTTSVRLGFLVADLDGLLPSLVDTGVTLLEGPRDSAAGRRAVVCDPDGHVIELTSRRIPDALCVARAAGPP
jgi:catechol 2,3-dioxygenase-like lactoylglutathione lyase family enzyme